VVVNKKSEVYQFKLNSQDQGLLLACLTGPERARMLRFRMPADQQRFLYARANLRILIAQDLGCAAADVVFDVGENGKPAVNGAVNFNISHSGDWVVVAQNSTQRVGVDIEKSTSKTNVLDLVTRFFHPREQHDFNALPISLRQQAFYHTWVCKEAIIKCDGRGLALGLENFAVSVDPRVDAAVLEMPSDLCPLRDWELSMLSVAEGYHAAVASAVTL
jgi:4'-phosphopantetheinyl transferase